MCVFTRIKPVTEGERGNNETVELPGTNQKGHIYFSGHETFHHIV